MKRLLSISTALLLAFGLCLEARAEGEKTAADSTASAYEKLLGKGARTQRGYLSVHRKGDKVYFEIPDSVMGREIVFGTTVKAISDNGAGLVGSKGELLLMSFAREGKKLQLRQRNVDALRDGDALSQSGEGAVLRSLSIAAFGPDSSAVVDMTGLLLEDDERLSPFVGRSSYDSYKLDKKYKKEYSYVTDAKAFEDNVSVTLSRSYTFTASTQSGRKVIKDEPLTALVTCTFLLLPEATYQARTADPRIGFFFTRRQRMADVGTSPKDVWLVNRWRMEPSDSAAWLRGELVKPVKPIVFHIDPAFPEWWKPYIHAAVNSWSKPFQRIGFQDAVVARDFPSADEDPAFDPDNIKYSCIRYEPVGIQNAMGPSWVDPRTGEIINASVYVYHDVIRLVSQWMLVQTAQAEESVRTLDLPKEKLGDALEYVIRHEVGHCLGLMHNMGASSSIPVDSLRSPHFTAENGTTWSIMDYARFNYVAQPGDKVRMTPPEFGKYDYWAIRWGYGPNPDPVRMLTDSIGTKPWYRYGKQQIYSQFFDPRNQNEDLSDDVVRASRYGVANLKVVHAGFMDWLAEGDEDYTYRTEVYQAILNQYLRYANHLIMNVGGLYRNEVVAGDGVKRFENVPAARQEACLSEAISMLENLDWLEDKAILERLPILGSPAYSLRRSIFSSLMYAPFACSQSDGVDTREMDFHTCMDRIYDFVWGPTQKHRRLTDAQRYYQLAFLQSVMKSGGMRLPSSAQSLVEEGMLYDDPVSGFEWIPRAIFNRGDITAADLYAIIYRVNKLLKSRLSGPDKAHYELLLSYIQYGTSLQ